jgi:hypothetical protein
MKAAAERHLEEAAAFIAVAESGDAKRAAYRKAAEEIEAAKRADQDLSNSEIGRRIGKGHVWVGRLLAALDRARAGDDFRIDWQRKDREVVGAEKVAREQPDAFVQAFEQAPPKVQRQIARQMVSTPAGRFVEQEVLKKQDTERQQARERAKERAQQGGLPLPAWVPRMIGKITEWGLAFAGLTDQLGEIPDGPGRDELYNAVGQLHAQTGRWLDALHPKPDLSVVEGRATEVRRRELAG